MENHRRKNVAQQGIVLLITLVVLVVLASMGYVLATRVASQIHRDQYLIDYQNARYACDSGLKYVLANLESGITAKPIDRPNEPDFSDVFAYTQEQYERFLAEWVAAHPPKEVYEQYGQYNEANNIGSISDFNTRSMTKSTGDMNDSNTTGYLRSFGDMNDSNMADWSRDPNKMAIPGPYGPPWPLVMRPIELEIGTAKVTIEIEDENAKLPLIWGTNSDKDKQREVDAAIGTFCEWMNMTWEQIDTLKRDLKKIGEVRPYTAGAALTFTAAPAAGSNSPADANVVRAGLSRRTRRRPPTSAQQQQQSSSQTPRNDAGAQLNEFVRLLHSSMIDIEPLAQPYIKTEQRTESILKYISRWGATQVNINTAPRQVLEAAFMFGGDAPDVAEAIIKARQFKPFTDVNDVQKKIYKYADSIRKSKDFIITTSTVFSVNITAVSGVAKVSTTAAVVMQGKKPRIIAVMSE